MMCYRLCARSMCSRSVRKTRPTSPSPYSTSPRGSPTSVNVAIVGSGPAGFYTAQQLLKRNSSVTVDILEQLPVPFGLVRFGVAPDHPEVKNVINQFTLLAQTSRCRFIGNIEVGRHISISQLRQYYDAVVMAYGADDDRVLGIPGEELTGVLSARDFVGWYNGYPGLETFSPDLSGDTALIIGHGNVAIDVARILLSPIDLLKQTDICAHALDALEQSRVKKVVMVGRRGPLQASFTIKELREMTRLPHTTAVLHERDFEQCQQILSELPRPRRRLTELMIRTAKEKRSSPDDGEGKVWEVKFLRSPVEILGDDGGVGGVRLEINKLEGYMDRAVAEGTGQYEQVDCSLVLRSIGYRSRQIDPGLPFDDNRGVVVNNGGRVLDSNGEHIPGLYCSGWVKRGPVGVILTTMNDAFETADNIASDIDTGDIPSSPKDRNGFLDYQKSSGHHPVLFSDWKKIDQEEQRRGGVVNKPREKIVSVAEMMRIVTST